MRHLERQVVHAHPPVTSPLSHDPPLPRAHRGCVVSPIDEKVSLVIYREGDSDSTPDSLKRSTPPSLPSLVLCISRDTGPSRRVSDLRRAELPYKKPHRLWLYRSCCPISTPVLYSGIDLLSGQSGACPLSEVPKGCPSTVQPTHNGHLSRKPAPVVTKTKRETTFQSLQGVDWRLELVAGKGKE